MQVGTIVKWNVKEGQKVKSGDVVADIETDKATMELQSFDDGTVATLAVAEGQSVPVGTVIMTLAGMGEEVGSVKASGGAARAEGQGASGRAPATSGTATIERSVASRQGGAAAQGGVRAGSGDANGHNATRDGGRVFASPLARKIAGESGVDLKGLSGTGPGGRIVRKDVEEAIAGTGTVDAETQPAGREVRTNAARAPLPAASASLEHRVVPLSNMRRIIAARLAESKATIPHYQVTVDIDMDALLGLRTQLNEQLASQGLKLSVNDFLVRACALAMHQNPYVNSRWVGSAGQEAIELLPDVNIGIAIALPEERGGGLVVATIRSADQIGLRQISQVSKQLAEKARTKGLSIQEMSDSTFTISNLGMFGVAHFNAIINPPNVAIAAVGAALERPVVRNGQVVPGHIMSMTMSSDHRVVDGAMAAQYLATVRELLEKPATLLV